MNNMENIINLIKIKIKGERASPVVGIDIKSPINLKVITPDGSSIEDWYNGGYSKYLWANKHFEHNKN